MTSNKNAPFILLLFMISAQVHAIDLGGTEVPKDRFIVYLLIGHSQAAGVIRFGNDKVTDPHAWVYRWATTRTWEPAKETGSLSAGLSGRGTGGPGMPFLKLMAGRHDDYYFGVISNASPAATCHEINTGSNGSNVPSEENRYWRDAQLFDEIISAAREVAEEATLGGVLCMLGSIEATRAADVTGCENFSNDIAEMARDMRDSLGIPGLSFIVADYEKGASGDFDTDLEWPAIIAGQLDSVPSKLSNCVLVNSEDIPLMDDHHFTIAGQKEWVRRAADSLHEKNFFPPPDASGLKRTTRSHRSVIRGEITVTYPHESVIISYKPITSGNVVLRIFTLQGKLLLQTRMTGTGETLETHLNGQRNIRIPDRCNCYIATISESNHRNSVKLHKIR
ncbi:MAG: hypothetical protein JW863_16055 [Chitinispirillaceae bacterium]|nr:hypothetical protein [Chitinispirillaceae bacterium]